MAAKDDYLMDTLIDMGLITQEQVDEASGEVTDTHGVIDVLVAKGELFDESVTMAKATQAGLEMVELEAMQLDDSVISAVPRNIVKRFNAVPIFANDDSVTMAMSDPTDLEAVDGLQVALGRQVDIQVASEKEIQNAIKRYYGGRENKDDSVSKMIQDITEGEVEIASMGALEADAGVTVDADAPIIKLVNQIIIDAYRSRASDIHLEPMQHSFRVRYRIDGVCHVVKSPPKSLQGTVIARLKIDSNMSISEKRIPQDGRIQCDVGDKVIDLRVSSVPTTHGESIVMRILDKDGLKLGLPTLGFFTDDQQTFEKVISLPDGILLVTGPTGSGKTTTLYSCLHFINRPDRKIITVEDPVEYQLAGINQVQVNETVGLTFAHALRSMLRQSPNVVMLGEIRDMETATIAINASLTGHLVFSTLHTNDAPSAVSRLRDLGVEPFLISSSVRAIMAQRLVRRVCADCSEPVSLSDLDLKIIEADLDLDQEHEWQAGTGCPACNGTGYRGRIGIFEILTLTPEMESLVYSGGSLKEIRDLARSQGMRTMRQDGLRKAMKGQATISEVLSVTSN